MKHRILLSLILTSLWFIIFVKLVSILYPLDNKKENKSGISSSLIRPQQPPLRESNASAQLFLDKQGPGVLNGDKGGICKRRTIFPRGPSGGRFITIMFL